MLNFRDTGSKESPVAIPSARIIMVGTSAKVAVLIILADSQVKFASR